MQILTSNTKYNIEYLVGYSIYENISKVQQRTRDGSFIT